MSITFGDPPPRGYGKIVKAAILETTTLPTIDDEGYPIAWCLRNLKDGMHHVVKCPVCGSEHFHGRGLGHRVSHCTPPKRGKAAFTLDPDLGYILRLLPSQDPGKWGTD